MDVPRMRRTVAASAVGVSAVLAVVIAARPLPGAPGTAATSPGGTRVAPVASGPGGAGGTLPGTGVPGPVVPQVTASPVVVPAPAGAVPVVQSTSS